jgi:hypothetical protein
MTDWQTSLGFTEAHYAPDHHGAHCPGVLLRSYDAQLGSEHVDEVVFLCWTCMRFWRFEPCEDLTQNTDSNAVRAAGRLWRYAHK